MFQLDVKSSFLQGEFEEIFVQQPKCSQMKRVEEKIYKLHKALYGLKQAPMAWYSRIKAYFSREGFERCFCEHTFLQKARRVRFWL